MIESQNYSDESYTTQMTVLVMKNSVRYLDTFPPPAGTRRCLELLSSTSSFAMNPSGSWPSMQEEIRPNRRREDPFSLGATIEAEKKCEIWPQKQISGEKVIFRSTSRAWVRWRPRRIQESFPRRYSGCHNICGGRLQYGSAGRGWCSCERLDLFPASS